MNEAVQSIRNNNWASLIQAQKESGLTIKQWCSENNVSENSYYYWLRKLRNQVIYAAQVNQPDLLPSASPPALVRVPDRLMPAQSQMPPLRITNGSTVIEVNNDACDRLLSFMKEVLIHAQ